MVRFKTQMRGYDKKEVDEYIHKTNEYSESKIRELENCIERLKDENDYLYAKNSEYRRNEERVSAAIVKAMEVKHSVEEEFRTKVMLEEDRLRIFKEKWTSFAQGIRRSNADRVVDEIDGYIRSFCDLFIKSANQDLNVRPEIGELSVPEQSYYKEQERIRNTRRGRKPKTSAEHPRIDPSEPAAPALKKSVAEE